MDVFLDHHAVDVEEARRLARAFEAEGRQVLMDDGSIVPERVWLRAVGDDGLRTPVLVVLATPRTPDDWIEAHRALAIAQQAWAEREGRSFALVPVLAGGRRAGGIATFAGWPAAELPAPPDLASGAMSALARDLDHWLKPRPVDGDTLQAVLGSGPFPGLRAFNEARATLFMGRDEAIRQCRQRIVEDEVRWLQIEGASGTGKTSLVRAGLLVSLWASADAPFQGWCSCILRPGADPIDDLALALHNALGLDADRVDPEHLATRLRAGENALVELVEQLVPEQGHRGLMLVLDQLDDGFTQQPLYPEAFEPFDKLIARTVISSSAFRLITTVRSDRLDDFRTMPQLEGQLNLPTTARHHLAPMREDELRAAIVDPIHLVGASIEDELVERLVDLAEPESMQLPKLAVVLRALWRDAAARDIRRPALTLADLQRYLDGQARPVDSLEEPYQGLRLAFSRVMDQSLEGLTKAELEAARDMLVHVVRPGRNGEDMRSMRPRGEVYQSTEHLAAAKARKVLEKLAGPVENRRPTGIEPFRVIERLGTEGDTESLDLRHDALLSEWRVLAVWLEEAREFLERRDELMLLEAKPEPFAKGPPPDPLVVRLCGEDLDGPTRARYLRALDDKSRKFIEDLRRRRPDRAIPRRVSRWALAGLLVVLVGLGGTAWWVLRYQRELADDTRMSAVRIAETEQAPHAARILLSGVRWPDRQAQWPDDVVMALENPAVHRSLVGPGAEILDLASSDDGTLVAAGLADGKVAWWSLDEPAQTRVVEAHTAAVRSVALAPDGAWLATASHDETGRIVRLDGSAEPVVLEGHEGPLTMVAVGPKGRRIVTGSHDGTARVWRPDGTLEGVLRGHRGWVSAVEISADGRRILTAGQDGTARVWTLLPGTGRDLPDEATLLDHGGSWVQPAHFSPDGARILTGAATGEIRVWTFDEEGQPVAAVLGRHEGGILSARFDATGSRIVSTGRDRTVRVWAVDGGESAKLELDDVMPVKAVFVPGGDVIVAVAGGQARRWTPGQSALSSTYGSGRTEVRDLVVRADPPQLVTGTADGVARVWNLDQVLVPEPVRPDVPVASAWFGGRGDTRLFAALAGGGARIFDRATGSLTGALIEGRLDRDGIRRGGSQVATVVEGRVRVWPADGSDARTVGAEDGPAARVAYSPDGAVLAVLGEDGVLRLYQGDSDAPIRSVSLRRELVSAFGFDPEGTRLVTGGSSGSVQVWSILGDFPLKSFEGFTGEVTAVAMAADGRVVAGGADRSVRVWSVADPELALVLEGHQGAVRSVSITPPGDFVLTLSDDRVARLWDLEHPRAPVRTSQESCTAVQAELLPDGPRVAVACRGGPAELWKPEGTAMRLSGDGTAVTHVAFSADGAELLTTSDDGPVSIWPASVDRLRGALLSDVEPCLTPGERVHFLGEDEPTAAARWRGCARACWGQTFDEGVDVESFTCLRPRSAPARRISPSDE